MPQLLDTIADILELSGAAVERNHLHLEALLPAHVAHALQLREHAVLDFDPQAGGARGEMVTYQSELIDRLLSLMRPQGVYAEIIIPDQYLKQNATAAAEARFSVVNGLLKAAGAAEKRSLYAVLNFKYVAVSDEKKEGLLRATINTHTLGAVPALASQLAWTSHHEGEGHTGLASQPFVQVYAAARRQVQLALRHELADFRRRLHRRLQRDIVRLNGYYQSLIDEIHGKIARRQLEGKEREAQEARMHATELERNRKIADAHVKYAIKVEVEPLGLLRINLPAVVVTAELRCRKLSREAALIWNPLLKEFEAAPCAGCGAGIYSIQLCEEKLHMLCRACSSCEGCRRSICHCCHPAKCPKCGETFILQ